MALIQSCPHCGEAISFALGTPPDQLNEPERPVKQLDLTLIRRVGSQLGRFGEDGCFLGWLE